ncbi:MAG: hypothetical protein HBSAPP03_19070 [Phycisphaerae bacterium]|nr:MAG: hypothetical protein HBSAPP03_19070 [Phycisphaerae bacterium]
MSESPAPVQRQPDPGTPRAALIAWIVATLLVAVTVLSNQFGDKAATKPVAEAGAIEPPGLDPMTLNAKVMTRLAKAVPMTEANLKQILGAVNKEAKSPAEILRSAAVAAELLNADAAAARLDLAATRNDAAAHPSPALAQDIDAARRLVKDPHAELTDIEREGLKARHGWFAELLLTKHLPDEDPARQALIGGGMRLAVGLALFGFALLVAGAGGLAAFIVMIVQINRGRLRRAFVPPAPGGSVYLEVLPVFVAAFLAMHLLAGLVPLNPDGHPPAWLRPTTLAIQASLLLLTLYPLLRGVSWTQHKALMGWHAGTGFWREVGAGVFGYFAGLPLMGLGMVLMLGVVAAKPLLAAFEWPQRIGIGAAVGVLIGGLAMILSLVAPRRASRPGLAGAASFGALIGLCAAIAAFGLLDGDTSQPKNPVVDLIAGASPLVLLIFVGMAVVWAPLAEESIFRGAFFRHLRARVGLGLAAVVSAIVFGVMHSYDFVLLVGVITLGFNFALMREWRDSLIAPMTAHALHNGTLMVLLLVLFKPLLA